MNNIINIRSSTKLIGAIAILFFLYFIWLDGKEFNSISTKEFFKLTMKSIGFTSTLTVFFISYFWKCKMFQGWLVKVPNLNGTWYGKYKSDWNGGTEGEAFLVIKQSLFDISCVSITKESKSYSRGTGFHIDEKSSRKVLSYLYSNDPEMIFREKSLQHDGVAELEIITAHKKRLKGKYWSDRGTIGDLDFEYFSKERRQTFEG